IQALADRLVRLLDAVITDPHQPVGRVEILTPEERYQLLEDWNDTGVALPPVCVPELFQIQVGRAPDHTAVICQDIQLSYAQLNPGANRLARALIARGAGPEDIVALALPRGAELIVALVAVLKPGAAYLPLDPGYPLARIEFMLTDAAPALVLTTTATSA